MVAIQSQLNYNGSDTNQIGFPFPLTGVGGGGGGSEFSLINNNGGIGIDQSLKDLSQQTLFHHQQYQQNRFQSILAAHMEKQRQEIHQLIRIQNERLRYVLQEQSKQEIEMIFRTMESKALVLMSQKQEEISKAFNKNMELEDLLRKMEMENQTWQSMARQNEAMVATLNLTLEQVRERAAAVKDEGSFCGGVDYSSPEKKMSGCWNCGSNGETRVLFLPCRHLCCCINCEAGIVLCPICNTPKKNRIEAKIVL